MSRKVIVKKRLNDLQELQESLDNVTITGNTPTITPSTPIRNSTKASRAPPPPPVLPPPVTQKLKNEVDLGRNSTSNPDLVAIGRRFTSPMKSPSSGDIPGSSRPLNSSPAKSRESETSTPLSSKPSQKGPVTLRLRAKSPSHLKRASWAGAPSPASVPKPPPRRSRAPSPPRRSQKVSSAAKGQTSTNGQGKSIQGGGKSSPGEGQGKLRKV